MLRLVVADTGPINYLILIGDVDLLPALFETVILPGAVAAELKDPDAPVSVRQWIASPPAWLDIRNDTPAFDPALERLDPGEKKKPLLPSPAFCTPTCCSSMNGTV